MLRKGIAVAAVWCLLFSVCTVGVQAKEQVQISALSAVLYCADSGEVLYEKAAYEKRPIASITKIMTAVLALEAEDREVTFTYDMIAEGSSMYLKVGEVIRLSELVKGMMMVSGNDAANAIAVSVAGSKEKFADRMNEKARQLGMRDTHFVTPSGLDDEQHYSTAYDMALLCSYAMKNRQFRAIVSQKSMSVSFVQPENKKQVYVNHNKLLSLYEGCIGIKTGFTRKAGRTLTSCAERNGVRLIAVTLNDGDDWNDHMALYDSGFAMVEKVTLWNEEAYIPVVGSRKQQIRVMPQESCSAVLKKGSRVVRHLVMPHFVYAPVQKDSVVGKVQFFLDGKMITESTLTAAESCLYLEAKEW